MDSINSAAESAARANSDDVIVSITAISASNNGVETMLTCSSSNNNNHPGNPFIDRVLGAETTIPDPISQVGFGYKSPDNTQNAPRTQPQSPESLNLGTQLKTEIIKMSSSTNMTPKRPPRSPNEAVVARRPSRVSSGFLRAKSRLVEPPHPNDHDYVNLDDVVSAKSPYRDTTTPSRTPPRVSVSTPKASPITPKTPLMAAVQGGDDDHDDDNDDVYKMNIQIMSTKTKKKVNMLVVLEWGVFVIMTGLLIASLTVDRLISFKIWSLAIWKWCVLAMVMFCGRLINEWLTNVVVFLIERNFVLKRKVLYFVYGMKRSVQVFLWLAFILLAWGLLFSRGVKRSKTTTKVLRYITKALAGFVVGSAIWLAKTLFIKTVAVAFHVRRFFDRIQDSLFHQYVLQALSGPPLVELAEKIGIEKAETSSGKLSFGGNKAKEEVIDIDRLNRMKQEKVSAWTMRGLIKVITGTKLSTISNSLEGRDDDDGGEQSSKEITSEWEAKSAANLIFKNVAKPGYKYVDEEDLLRFLKRVEVEHVFPLFEGATESGKIKKSALTKWVVNAYLERKFLAHSLNDTKTAVEELNKIASGIVLIVNIIVWNLMMGFLTTKILLFISSQLLLVVFMFGNTAKTVFEAIIFVFIMHPFDVGDRCVIDGVQMVVDEMNILTTIFLRYDNEKIIYPNSVLATKPVSNFYRSPEMSDSVEFAVDFSTSVETLSALKTRIKTYIDSKPQHWRPNHSIQIIGFEDMNKMNLGLYVGHTINFQNSGEKSSRKCDLLMELKRIFEDLGIKYHPLPQEVHVTYVGSPASANVAYN